MRDRLPYLLGAALAAGALVVGRTLRADQIPIPRCTFLRITGYPCPFCGTTRSFFATAQGSVGEALRNAPLGVLAYGATWLLLAWCLYATVRPAGPWDRPNTTPYPRVLVYGIAGLIIAIWVYRLAMGYK
jgi:hypothetical protein